MLQLVYISSCRAEIDPAMLTGILDTSRRNNKRAGLTGLLVAGGRRFLQVLEGPEAAVLATYARIQADPRHRACVLLSRATIAERAFGDWSMAFQPGGAADEGAGLDATVDRLTATLADPNLRAQFTGFARLHRKAA
jgi:hypothetical protein